MFLSGRYIKTRVVYLSTFDGSEIDDKRLLDWLHFSLDTHLIREWYKNGEGYFVKFYNDDFFSKVERSLL